MKTYFPALDGLRFFAFLLVFFHHTSFVLRGDWSGNPLYYFFRNSGWVGVSFFFVLTGFLVTVLLLQERKEKGTFSMKNFLARRALRIWPLYFIALIVGYFVVPHVFKLLNWMVMGDWYRLELFNRLMWFGLFFGNWNIFAAGWGYFRAINELWVIGADQQFYILWPILLVFLKSFRSVVVFSLTGILLAVFSRYLLLTMGLGHPQIYVSSLTWVDSFMVGAILAACWHYKSGLLNSLNKFLGIFGQLVALGFFVFFLVLRSADNPLAVRIGVWDYFIIAVLIGYLILSLIAGKSVLNKFLRASLLTHLGKVSFGLYIWHVLALDIAYHLLNVAKFDLVVPVLSLGLTILLAEISFKFIEQPFLKIKAKI